MKKIRHTKAIARMLRHNALMVSFLFLIFFSQKNVAQDFHFMYKPYYDLDVALKNPDSVYYLKLSQKNLQSSLYKINSLTNLRVLIMNNCKLNDLSVLDFQKINKLKYLDLSGNSIREIPPGLTQLKSLQKLVLSGNLIQTLPETFGELDSLAVLEINNNKLISTPSSFAKLRSLRELDMANNNLQRFPAVSADMKLDKIYLSNNNISAIPDNIGELDVVGELYLGHNSLREFPVPVLNMKSLQFLDLSGNTLNEIPDAIGLADKLKTLILRSCNIQKIPYSLNKLKALETLDLSHNLIEEIPDNFFSKTDLKETSASLKNLINFDMGNNRISVLPSTIINLRSLWVLNLDSNRIEKLPDNIGDLLKLKELNISNNKIKKLPESLYRLALYMKVLDISNNLLSTIPPGLNEFSYDCQIFFTGLPITHMDDKVLFDNRDNAFLAVYSEYEQLVNLKHQVNNFNDLKYQLDFSNKKIVEKNRELEQKYKDLAVKNRKLERELDAKNKQIGSKDNEIKEKENILAKLTQNTIIGIIVIIIITILALLILYLVNKSKGKKKIQKAYNELDKVHSELNDAYAQLKTTTDELVESQKKAFISDLVVGLAHDLNTPVSNAKLSSDILRHESSEIQRDINTDGITREQMEKYINNSFDSGDLIYSEMQRIAEWIKGFRTISSDQVKNEERFINVKEYLDLCIKTLSFKLKKKNIDYEILCPKGAEMRVFPGFISQILINIINNAIEHGFEGYNIPDKKIRIWVEQNAEATHIFCRNNGRPIPATTLPRIFDEYYSTKSGIKGMGLSNVRKIVEQGLHGSIDCRADDHAVTFTINIPNQHK